MVEYDERTAEDLHDQGEIKESLEGKEKEALFKEVRGKMEKRDERIATKERFEKAGGWKEAGRRAAYKITDPFLKKAKEPTSKLYKEVKTQYGKSGGVIRELTRLIAPKGSLVSQLTTPKKGTTASGKPRVKYGRGRPSGTFKVRVLPYSGRRVKVATAVYKKMLSAEKAQYRLARAERQASLQIQADQLAMQQDQRYQPSSSDQFLEEPDMQHEYNVQQAQQQAEMAQFEPQRQPQQGKVMSFMQNLGRGISRLGGGMGARGQIQVDQYGRPVGQISTFGALKSEPRISVFGGAQQPSGGGLRREPGMGRLVREPMVTTISGGTSLLGSRRQFNRSSIPRQITRQVTRQVPRRVQRKVPRKIKVNKRKRR